jgi:hypothetical protein
MNKTHSNNPLRKWQKKLRNAKTPEQIKKAEQMIRALTPIPPKTKVHQPTDNELMDMAIKKNKQLFKEKQEKERIEKQQRGLSLEKQQNRLTIKETIKKKEELLDKTKEEFTLLQEEYKKQEEEINDKINAHIPLANSVSEKHNLKLELTKRYMKTKLNKDEITQETSDKLYKKHKRKIDRDYNRYIRNICAKIEHTVHQLMKDKDISYEESKQIIYGLAPSPSTPELTDGCAEPCAEPCAGGCADES